MNRSLSPTDVAPLNATERAELERLRAHASHQQDESGAIAGFGPIDRVNRIHVLADGLESLSMLFDSAMHADPEHQTLPLGWVGSLYLVGVIAKDISNETSALWDEAKTPDAPDVDPILASCDDTLQAHSAAEAALVRFAESGDPREVQAALAAITQAKAAMDRGYVAAARIGGGVPN